MPDSPVWQWLKLSGKYGMQILISVLPVAVLTWQISAELMVLPDYCNFIEYFLIFLSEDLRSIPFFKKNFKKYCINLFFYLTFGEINKVLEWKKRIQIPYVMAKVRDSVQLEIIRLRQLFGLFFFWLNLMLSLKIVSYKEFLCSLQCTFFYTSLPLKFFYESKD